jgi:uncharacterized protein (UPF0335 family)
MTEETNELRLTKQNEELKMQNEELKITLRRIGGQLQQFIGQIQRLEGNLAQLREAVDEFLIMHEGDSENYKIENALSKLHRAMGYSR